jgi:hypothetical protein
MALKQRIVQSAWLAAALAFEPFQHVGITPHDKLLLDGQVLLAAVRPASLCAEARVNLWI